MDIRRLGGVLTQSGNTSQGSFSELPATVLEAVVPGYSLLSKFILQVFGFDIGVVVTLGLVLAALAKALDYLWDRISSIFFDHLTSSVYIEDNEDLYGSLYKWIAEQRVAKVSRTVQVVTRHGASTEDEGEHHKNTNDALDDNGLFHFGKWAAKMPPQYEPWFGRHRFWHAGHLFVFDRSRKTSPANGYQPAGEWERTRIMCVGRSTQPIKKLLEHVKSWAYDKERAVTVIKRPADMKIPRYAGYWSRINSRPSRPISTVALDHADKAHLVNDINEFLHPATPRWYAARGIPYRRGYLFHGPTGTGKSSLSFALAGLFGLEIHVVSLLEPSLTETVLTQLFDNLPRRCIVLLEDIDTAGLTRDVKSDSAQEAEGKQTLNSHREGEKLTATDIVRAIRAADDGDKRGDNANKGISLSGLLNAIDGVASHEGRVLIMTTNHPEKLDSALIRPGRVDMQIAFTLATRQQVQAIFLRMYTVDEDDAAVWNGSPRGRGGLKPVHAKPGDGDAEKTSSLSRHQLGELCRDFADRIPEGKFSPAEIQDFLIERKTDPHKVVMDVDAWRDRMMAAKERGK